MRVCPKCGYLDDALWRGSVKPYLSFMRLSDFQDINPTVATKLRTQKFVEEPPFVYHLTKGLNVERQAIIDNPTYKQKWVVPTELGSKKQLHKRPSHLLMKKVLNTIATEKIQTKLLEVE